MVIDILVSAVLLISSLIAFARGFIREVLTILGVVGGIAASYFGGPYAKVYFHEWLGVQPEPLPEGVKPEKLFDVIPYNLVADALAYGSIFIIVVIVLSVVSHVLAESVKSLGLGAIDRSFGLVFGLARAAFLVGLMYLPFHMYWDQEDKDRWLGDSKSRVYLEQIAEAMEEYLPEATKKKGEEEFKKLQDAGAMQEKLDLLNPDQQPPQPAAAPGGAAIAPQDGYSAEDRGKMDELIQRETGQRQPAVPPAGQPSGQGAR